ncbi:MAG: MATE family efflux transporter [Peptococcaceae bacterium]|nr:MATE family efflux transporter [Peptococcaceae bacterium]
MPQPKDTTAQLGTDAVWRLIARFSIPSIISMSVAAIYNVVDRFFIGRYVDERALGGLTVAFPFMMLMFAVGALIGIGGSTLISIRFGEQKKEQAHLIFGNMVALSALSSLGLAILGTIFITPLLRLMGATPNNLGYAVEYMRVILIGLIFQLPSFAMAALARVEGRPRLAMATQMIAGVSNIFLDYLFIVPLRWGVTGAALATILGQFLGFAILVWHFFFSGRSLLRLYRQNLRLQTEIVRAIGAIGASSFFMQMGTSVSSAMFNTALASYGGDEAISSLGAMSSLFTLALMPILGLQQGLGPIIGYNHGLKRSDRVWRALILGIGIGSAFAATVFLAVELWPTTFASLFIDKNSPTMAMCVHGMRINFLMLPLLSVNVIGSTYFQSTAQSLKAFVLSVSRSVIFLIPCVLILPPIFQLNGVWMSAPTADFLSISLTFALLLHSAATARGKEKAGLI